MKRFAVAFVILIALSQVHGQTAFGQSGNIIYTEPLADRCDGDCGATTSGWMGYTRTVHISKSGSANYAKPKSTTDDCTIQLFYFTRSCSGTPNDGPHKDVYLRSLCTSCHIDPQELLRRVVLRAHLNDDPLSIISSSNVIQYFRFIIPSCMSTFQCSDSISCLNACDCPENRYMAPGTSPTVLVCQNCCSYGTVRIANDGCDVVIRLNDAALSPMNTAACLLTAKPMNVEGSVFEGTCSSSGSPCQPACFYLDPDQFSPIPR